MDDKEAEQAVRDRIIDAGLRSLAEKLLGESNSSVLREAGRLVSGARNADYGHPLDNHTTTADLITAYLHRKYGNVPVTLIALDADDVCWFNILQKCSRDANAPKRDNLVDVAGYAENIQIVRDERDRRAA